jgi:hypothetical protein
MGVAVALAGAAVGCSVGLDGVVYCPTPSDDFTDPSTLACWNRLDPGLIAGLEIGTSPTPFLMMAPTAMQGNAWFDKIHGPFIYKNVTGDFLLLAEVYAGTAGNAGGTPTGSYNTAGLLARDPSGDATHSENWVLLDVGHQGSELPTPMLGTMVKNTHGGSSDKYASPGGSSGKLAICRVGSEFQYFEVLYSSDNNMLTAHPSHPSDTLNMPATLQVGLTVGAYGQPFDAVGYFGFATFATPPSSAGDCLTAVNNL